MTEMGAGVEEGVAQLDPAGQNVHLELRDLTTTISVLPTGVAKVVVVGQKVVVVAFALLLDCTRARERPSRLRLRLRDLRVGAPKFAQLQVEQGQKGQPLVN